MYAPWEPAIICSSGDMHFRACNLTFVLAGLWLAESSTSGVARYASARIPWPHGESKGWPRAEIQMGRET